MISTLKAPIGLPINAALVSIRAMRRRGIALACVAMVGLAGCGGDSKRQDADEPEGSFRVEVVDASFPERQALAQPSTLSLEVRNADDKAIPNVAVTIETAGLKQGDAPGSFAQARSDPGLADASRPVWILDCGPVGGDTAYTNTWALGRLEAGATKKFEWKVTAVQAGDYTVAYEVNPGLDGKAKPAQQASGSFDVNIDDTPPDARVDDDGKVVREGPGSDEDSESVRQPNTGSDEAATQDRCPVER